MGDDPAGGARFYLDPASPIVNGPWLAGYAAIADTPFVVLVQTPDRIARAFIIAVALVILAGGAYLAWRLTRRRNQL